MKLLRIVPFVFLIALGATGCGKAKAKTAGEKLVDEAEAMAAAFCKCKKEDAACLAKAIEPADANEAALEKEFPDESKIPADLKKRMDTVEANIKKCSEGGGEVVLPAGGSDEPAAGGGDQEKLLTDLAAVKDKVCACADKDCVAKELEAANAFDARFKEVFGDMSKVPADVMTKVGDIQKGVADCAAKYAGEAPATPPPAGDAAAEATKVLDEMEALTEEICKCADMACAQPLGEKTEPLEAKLHELYPDKASVPAELMTRGEGIEQKMGECVAKFAQ